ncbi:histone deacetylase domain-containing protein [Ditylenchus destructor]|uniref:histone deacetylase n=1 Tax=Ditylenchus destructor TaxID=166010 RepID=A0AAD4N638_9BILA|nr:histone deacetylase domain-containing protein [Ditylenchus destructor]
METYYITDDKMQLHENLWDKNHIETPERIAAINKILQETSLLSKCKKLHSSKADIEDISLVHSEEYIESIRATTSLSEKSFVPNLMTLI